MFLNSVPGVGHIKGVIHFVTGDREKGRKAIREATRTTLVIGGGVVGSIVGPAGAAVGAAASGAFMDSVTSLIAKEPQGICGNIHNIVRDIRQGKPPIMAALDAGITVGADVLTGLSAGALTSTATSQLAGSKTAGSVGKKIGKSIGKVLKKTLKKDSLKTEITKAAPIAKKLIVAATAAQVTKLPILSPKSSPPEMPLSPCSNGDNSNQLNDTPSTNKTNQSVVCSLQNDETSGRLEQSKHESSIEIGGDKDGSKLHSQTTKVENCEIVVLCSLEALEELKSVFGVESINEICVEGAYIFDNLSSTQQDLLSTIIENMKRQEYDLKEITEITAKFIKAIGKNKENIDYKDFCYALDYVMIFIGECVARINDLFDIDDKKFIEIVDLESFVQLPMNERLQSLAKIITKNTLSPEAVPLLSDVNIDRMVTTFEEIKSQVIETTIEPNFANIYSVVYHYYRNRVVNGGNRQLTVPEFLNTIKELLENGFDTQDYEKLQRKEITEFYIEAPVSDLGSVKVVLRYVDGSLIIFSVNIM